MFSGYDIMVISLRELSKIYQWNNGSLETC